MEIAVSPVTRILTLLFALLLPWGAAVAAEEAPEQSSEKRAYLGAGPYIQSQPYEDADAFAVASPVVFFDNRRFYMRWMRLGMYVLGGDDWGLSVTAQPVPLHYDASDSPVLAGMEDRENSWEAGLAISGENELGFAELSLFHDILGKSKGTKLRLELGKTIKRGRWTLVPSVLAIGFSDNYNDYYYGVSNSEATGLRPAYSAGAGINLAAQAYLMFDITENWHLLGNIRADYLSSEISDSPIVDQDWMLSGMVSVLYSFPFTVRD